MTTGRRILLADADAFYVAVARLVDPDGAGKARLCPGEPLAATAHRIRDTVLAETTLFLSIGGATSKLVAKLAAGVAKPRPGSPSGGVHVVAPGAEAEFMLRFALADVPHIGPKVQERLPRLGRP